MVPVEEVFEPPNERLVPLLRRVDDALLRVHNIAETGEGWSPSTYGPTVADRSAAALVSRAS